MANNLRVFNTNSEYQSADLILPAVSYVVETDKVIYEPTPPTPSIKWKATYSDSSVTSAECDSSSEITNGEIELTDLVSVEIGDCVTSIGFYAFDGCDSLTSVIIPNSVTSIVNGAFYNCRSLSSVTIPDTVTSIGDSAFNNCRSISSVTIPNSVTSIGDMAFQYCYSLATCTIGSGVTSIGNNAFASCRNLTSIDIPSGVTSIGNRLFYDCSSLSSIDLPSGITSIGTSAFQGCNGLTSVTVNATTPPTLGLGAFVAGPTCQFYVPAESVEAYKTAKRWSTYADRIQAIP